MAILKLLGSISSWFGFKIKTITKNEDEIEEVKEKVNYTPTEPINPPKKVSSFEVLIKFENILFLCVEISNKDWNYELSDLDKIFLKDDPNYKPDLSSYFKIDDLNKSLNNYLELLTFFEGKNNIISQLTPYNYFPEFENLINFLENFKKDFVSNEYDSKNMIFSQLLTFIKKIIINEKIEVKLSYLKQCAFSKRFENKTFLEIKNNDFKNYLKKIDDSKIDIQGFDLIVDRLIKLKVISSRLEFSSDLRLEQPFVKLLMKIIDSRESVYYFRSKIIKVDKKFIQNLFFIMKKNLNYQFMTSKIFKVNSGLEDTFLHYLIRREKFEVFFHMVHLSLKRTSLDLDGNSSIKQIELSGLNHETAIGSLTNSDGETFLYLACELFSKKLNPEKVRFIKSLFSYSPFSLFQTLGKGRPFDLLNDSDSSMDLLLDLFKMFFILTETEENELTDKIERESILINERQLKENEITDLQQKRNNNNNRSNRSLIFWNDTSSQSEIELSQLSKESSNIDEDLNKLRDGINKLENKQKMYFVKFYEHKDLIFNCFGMINQNYLSDKDKLKKYNNLKTLFIDFGYTM